MRVFALKENGEFRGLFKSEDDANFCARQLAIDEEGNPRGIVQPCYVFDSVTDYEKEQLINNAKAALDKLTDVEKQILKKFFTGK